MTKYIDAKVNISEGQKEKLQHAIKANCSADYQKAFVELDNQDLYDLISGWEDQINKYLKDQGVTSITILYDNRIFPKTYLDNPSNASVIKIKGVWINDENKPFLQLWLE